MTLVLSVGSLLCALFFVLYVLLLLFLVSFYTPPFFMAVHHICVFVCAVGMCRVKREAKLVTVFSVFFLFSSVFDFAS